MSEKSNKLKRVNNIITKAMGVGSQNYQKKVIDVWKEVFSITDENHIELEKNISNKLSELDDEISQVIKFLNKQYPNENTDLLDHLTQIRRGLLPSLLQYQWEHIIKNSFRPENLSVLKTSYFIFPNEGILDENEIKKLREQCLKLHESIYNSKLPSSLKEEICKRLKNIQSCIEKIDLFGMEALQSANNELAGMILLSKDSIKKSIDSDEQQEKDNLQEIKKICGFVDIVNKGISSVKELYSNGVDFIQLANNIAMFLT